MKYSIIEDEERIAKVLTAHKPHFVDELVDNASDICIGAYVDWQRAPTKKNKHRRTLRGNDRCFTFSIQRLGFRGNLNVVARSPAQSPLFSLFLDCDQKFVSKVLQRARAKSLVTFHGFSNIAISGFKLQFVTKTVVKRLRVVLRARANGSERGVQIGGI